MAGLLAFPHPVSGVPYINLKADSRSALRQLIDQTRAAYQASQLALLEDADRKRQAECEAYAVSDPVEPRYLIQGSNSPVQGGVDAVEPRARSHNAVGAIGRHP